MDRDALKRLVKKRSRQVARVEHLFHGIEVIPGKRCCPAARALAKRRILSSEAPRLPLQACTNPNHCTCTYKHFTDRRTEARREWDIGLPERFRVDERRTGRGRRVTD